MPEAVYPRPIYLSNYQPFQASVAFALGDVVRPNTPNDHVYIVTVAGVTGSEPSWPTSSQGTVISGGVTFTENGTAPGVQFLKYLKKEKDYSEITLISKYEDGGRDFNLSAADAPQIYELEYDGLTDDQVEVLDDFFDTHKYSEPFTFVEPRDEPWGFVQGDTVPGCVFVAPYQKDHNKVKYTQSRKVVIAKYPA